MAPQSPSAYEAAADLGQAHARLGAQDTLHQLFRAHFQREEGHGRTRLGGVHRQVERERGLAHARTSSQDDEIPATEAVEQGIRILEARRHTGHVIALFGQARELFEGVHQKRVHLGERGGDAFLRDVEQGLFSFLHHLVQVVGRVVGERVDLRGGIDELAQDGGALHDFSVVLPVGEREGVVGQVHQVGLAADGLQLARTRSACRQARSGRQECGGLFRSHTASKMMR